MTLNEILAQQRNQALDALAVCQAKLHEAVAELEATRKALAKKSGEIPTGLAS